MNTPINRKQALSMLTTGALCVVYFTKSDGTERRMVCRYIGAASTFYTLRVFDVEKGAYRSVPLTRVHEVKPLATRVKTAAAARPALPVARRPAPPPAGYPDWRSAVQDLF